MASYLYSVGVVMCEVYSGERLRFLDLSNNKIGDAGCESLYNTLKQCKQLQSQYL